MPRPSSAHTSTPKEAYEPAPWAGTDAHSARTALEYGFCARSTDQWATVRVLTVVDKWSRESPVLEVGFRLTGSSVAEALSRVGKTVRLPACITVDHGTEFTSSVSFPVK